MSLKALVRDQAAKSDIRTEEVCFQGWAVLDSGSYHFYLLLDQLKPNNCTMSSAFKLLKTNNLM